MVAKFLDHSKRELRQQRRRRQRERRCISKTITLHVHHSFSTFFSHRCTTATWNFLISPARFTELVNGTRKVSFSLSKLRYGPFGFNLENFANIWQSEWNWIRSMKFETARIYFLSEFSVCCTSSKSFATMATWRNDFSLMEGPEWNFDNTHARSSIILYIVLFTNIVLGLWPILNFFRIK